MKAKPVVLPVAVRWPRRMIRAAIALTAVVVVLAGGMSALASGGDEAASAAVLRAGRQIQAESAFDAVSVGIDEQGKKLTSKAKGGNDSALLADATERMLRAALSDRDASDEGLQMVRGEQTMHYRVSLSEKAQNELARLSAQDRAWFGLEIPSIFYTLDVFVADNLIRRVELHGRYFTTVDYTPTSHPLS